MILLLAGLLVCCGCASSGYWTDRVRDGADVFALAVGRGFGAKARVGPITAGLLEDYTFAGLRGGEFCRQDAFNSARDLDTFAAIDWQIIVDNAERFNLARLDRGKNFEACSVGCGKIVPFLSLLSSEAYSPAYYAQIEAVIGLQATVRLGFNIAEFFDFLLGWGTLDVLHDDIGRTR